MSTVEYNELVWSQLGHSSKAIKGRDQGAIDLDKNYIDAYSVERPIDLDGPSIFAYYGASIAFVAAMLFVGSFFS